MTHITALHLPAGNVAVLRKQNSHDLGFLQALYASRRWAEVSAVPGWNDAQRRAFLHSQAEPGSSCPLTMTHAAVPALRREASLSAWADKAAYDRTAQTLVGQFIDNFAQFAEHVDEGVRQAAPQAAVAA